MSEAKLKKALKKANRRAEKYKKQFTNERKNRVKAQQQTDKEKRLRVKAQREVKKYKEREEERTAMWTALESRNKNFMNLSDIALFLLVVMENASKDTAMVKHLTRLDRDVFDHLLELFEDCIINDPDMKQHFREDQTRKTDPGNQCNLTFRQLLLMALMSKAHDLPQKMLGLLFAIDQSTVSDYLKMGDDIFDKVLKPTPYNIQELIANVKTLKELKELLPGRGAGQITIDGIEIRARRPQDNAIRKERYSGKKKTFTIGTITVVNKPNYIVGISESCEGSHHDMNICANNMPILQRWIDNAMKCIIAESKESGREYGKQDLLRVLLDLGFQGFEKYYPDTNAILPHKKPKNGQLTKTQHLQNKTRSRNRIPIEHSNAGVKIFSRVNGPYKGTPRELNRELNIVCGLYNLQKMWNDGTYWKWRDKIVQMEEDMGKKEKRRKKTAATRSAAASA